MFQEALGSETQHFGTVKFLPKVQVVTSLALGRASLIFCLWSQALVLPPMIPFLGVQEVAWLCCHAHFTGQETEDEWCSVAVSALGHFPAACICVSL